ncbi:hypothetical protein EU527_12635 [Candidatus Thorarchaeota archaeon]|nr:MAG: hypothetical protein EU527_12635 [Candidatus Thorarchaeota archaeon]
MLIALKCSQYSEIIIFRRYSTISSFSSKYFGWLIALFIVLLGGWFLLPQGYNDAIAILAPSFGNYIRPTLVMVNLILVNPMNSFMMVAVWAGAGFIGGMMAGTKKGAFVVGLMVWLSCLGIVALCVYLLFQSGISLGTLIIPPGTSIVDLFSIPLIQSLIDQILPLIAGIGGGGFPDIMALVAPLLIWFFTPVIVVIVAAILGAVVRPKEEF